MGVEKKPFHSLINEVTEEMGGEDKLSEESGSFPLVDADDIEILMHRETHFGGKFSFMLEYYEKGGKGVMPYIEPRRIRYLAAMEEKLGENLAAKMLSGADAEKVARAREAYRKLREICEVEDASKHYPRLLADLIVSEEEEPVKEIEAIVQQGSSLVPVLIDVLKKEDFSDPVFPGYGETPILVAKCLGRIGDERAVVPLYECIGKSEDEDLLLAVLDALRDIGEAAKDFLLQLVVGRPFTADNSHSGMALAAAFLGDPQVAKVCFDQLQKEDTQRYTEFYSFLVLASAGLREERRKDFIDWSKETHLPQNVRLEVEAVLQDWSDMDQASP